MNCLTFDATFDFGDSQQRLNPASQQSTFKKTPYKGDKCCNYEARNEKSFTSLIAMQPLVPDHAYMPHMKAIHVPFNWMYSSLICNQRLQSDRPEY